MKIPRTMLPRLNAILQDRAKRRLGEEWPTIVIDGEMVDVRFKNRLCEDSWRGLLDVR